MGNLTDVEIQANADREKLKSLLAFKPQAVQNTILAMYDESHTLTEKGSDIVSILGMSGIKSKRDLSGALEKAGVRFGTPDYNDFYDRYCTANPNLSI